MSKHDVEGLHLLRTFEGSTGVGQVTSMLSILQVMTIYNGFYENSLMNGISPHPTIFRTIRLGLSHPTTGGAH